MTPGHAMRFPILLRKLHRWGALLIAIPLLFTIASGVALQLGDRVDWIEPSARAGTPGAPTIAFSRVLDAVRAVPQAGVERWEDIEHLEVRPADGAVNIRTANHTEIQLDARSGDVLAVARSRAGLIKSIHNGSFFGEIAETWVFLPATLLFVGLWISGIYLGLLPYFNRRAGARRHGRSARRALSPERRVRPRRVRTAGAASLARGAFAVTVLGAVTLGAGIRSVGFATVGTATIAIGADAASLGAMARPGVRPAHYTYQPVEPADFDALVGRLVRVRTVRGEVERDELVAVERDRIVLRRSRAAGHGLYEMRRSAVREVEVLGQWPLRHASCKSGC